jgi:hypothetical protein
MQRIDSFIEPFASDNSGTRVSVEVLLTTSHFVPSIVVCKDKTSSLEVFEPISAIFLPPNRYLLPLSRLHPGTSGPDIVASFEFRS